MTPEKIQELESALELLEMTLRLADQAIQNAQEAGVDPKLIEEFEEGLMPSRQKYAEAAEKLRVAKGLPERVVN